MNGLRAEFRLLLSRRSPHVLLALMVLGFVVAAIAVFVTTNEPDPGLREAGISDRALGTYKLTRFITFMEESSGLMIVVFLLLGASAMGAEWGQRSITASLTYEPRRGILLGSKLVATVSLAFVAALGLQLILSLFLFPTVLVKGSTAGADASWLLNYVQALLRVGFLAAFAAALGFSIATVGRNTAAALGIVFVWIAVLEPLLRAWKPEWVSWFLFDNIATVSTGKAQSTGFPPVKGPGIGEAMLVLAFYAGIIYTGALAIFRRRDVA
jgi:ABC-type transport system involved in multi-copper enzyme maturation permease subunit